MIDKLKPFLDDFIKCSLNIRSFKKSSTNYSAKPVKFQSKKTPHRLR